MGHSVQLVLLLCELPSFVAVQLHVLFIFSSVSYNLALMLCYYVGLCLCMASIEGFAHKYMYGSSKKN